MRSNDHGCMASLADVIGMVRAANAQYGVTKLDGTYVVRAALSDSARRRLGAYYLERVAETSGYEVGYDAIAPESMPTSGGPRAWLTPGDRIGVWTHGGVVYFDRTAHVTGPWDIAAIIARECGQVAIWDWARSVSIDAATGEVL